MAKKILIVDDSDSIREVIGYTLETEGYEVIKSVNGNDALQHFNGTQIDLVITDLHMPELDGIGLIKRIRQIKEYSTVPILFLTTESQLEKKMEAKEAGATGWIVKPFVPAKLLAAISKVIR